MPRRSDTSDLTCALDANPVLDKDNVYFSDQGWAYRHYKNLAKTEFWDEILIAGQALEDDGTPDATADTFGTASPTFLVGDSDQSPVISLGGIGSVANISTSVSFPTDESALAVTVTPGAAAGSVAATATVSTDSSGDVIEITFTSPGSGYELGEVLSLTDTTGVAAFIVNELA